MPSSSQGRRSLINDWNEVPRRVAVVTILHTDYFLRSWDNSIDRYLNYWISPMALRTQVIECKTKYVTWNGWNSITNSSTWHCQVSVHLPNSQKGTKRHQKALQSEELFGRHHRRRLRYGELDSGRRRTLPWGGVEVLLLDGLGGQEDGQWAASQPRSP